MARRLVLTGLVGLKLVVVQMESMLQEREVDLERLVCLEYMMVLAQLKQAAKLLKSHRIRRSKISENPPVCSLG